jgi:Domain of unknown function (DUF4440)
MSTRTILLASSILTVLLFATGSATLAQTAGNASLVAAITKIENGSVKADLAFDKRFYEKILADDWTGCDSDGVWYTKADVLKQFADPAKNKTNAEKMSDLKVRGYGNTAIATYKESYDALVNGEHGVRIVISTDTIVKMGDEWKEVASHSCQSK